MKRDFLWRKQPFESAVEDMTGGQPKVQKRDYLVSGPLPVIDQGQDFIAGYTDDHEMAYKGPLPVVLFGDHTRVFKYVDFPFALGADGVKVLVPKESLDPLFLFFYFQSVQIPSRGYSRHFKFLKELLVPFPPFSEQRRIVEILDQADALRKKRAEADAKAARILPALFNKMFGDPVDWTSAVSNVRPLGSLVEVQGGGTPSKQNSDYWNGEIPWVSPKDMKQDILCDATDHIARSAVEQTTLKFIDPGAVLIVVRGMILAHTVPIALAGCQLTINQDMKALQPKCNDIDSIYLFAALKASSRQLLSQVRTAAHGTRKLDTDELLQLPILIPPPQDLEKFRQRMATCNQIVSSVKKTGEIFEQLFETMLHRAFSGDLTAKWREAHMKELLAEMEEQTRSIGMVVNT